MNPQEYKLDNQIRGLRNQISFLQDQIKREDAYGVSSEESKSLLEVRGNEYDAIRNQQVEAYVNSQNEPRKAK